MKKTSLAPVVISHRLPCTMNAMADELEKLLKRQKIFTEKDEERRRQLRKLSLSDGHPHQLPARVHIMFLVEVMQTGAPITDAEVKKLISEARACAESLGKVLDRAAEEAAKKPVPVVSGRHFNHMRRKGFFERDMPPHHRNVVRRSMALLRQMRG